MKRAWLSWSSGKDCAWALHILRQQAEVAVVALLTTFNRAANRVAMHAVRRELVEEQARLVGLPLKAFDLPWPCSNDEYQEIMRGACALAVQEGVECIAFGDLFLEDVRAYREQQLKPTGLEPLFPIWGIPTDKLARQMSDAGLRAMLTCIDPAKLGREFAGREWGEVQQSFPSGVDVCGERGEFHTFAFAGPMFSRAIDVEPGEIVERDGFVFADMKITERSVLVRKAAAADAEAIAQLSAQLGYPVPASDLSERLLRYQTDPAHVILVAEQAREPVGWIDVCLVDHLVSGGYGEIGAMVVASHWRGRGIGKTLLAEAEKWIKSNNVYQCVVRSRTTRLDAHRFYERENFTLEKTTAVFRKKLT